MSSVQQTDIDQAKNGDAKALETIVRSIQDKMHQLSVRMMADPMAAEDATQEILIRIVTKLSTYRGDSKFETWAYRVATNYLLTARKIIAKDPGLSFQMFSDDLLDGLVDEQNKAPDDHLLLNELRIKCTMAMLMCLDRNHRAAYVLGEVLELDHGEAAAALEITPANFRKRLSRARKEVEDFTAMSCGLVKPAAACSCQKRLPVAMAKGRVGPEGTASFAEAPKFADVTSMARTTQANLIAAKLQRATGPLRPVTDFATEVLRIVDPPPIN